MENTLSMTTAWQEAEEMRKSGNFEAAFPIFMENFKANANESSLWRAIPGADIKTGLCLSRSR